MPTLTQGCRTPNRCRATVHVCDPEPGSAAWLANLLSDAAMAAAPSADDLAEELEWIVLQIRAFFDYRRHEATTPAVLSDSRHRLVAAIGGAA
jgi:hypothetical protein